MERSLCGSLNWVLYLKLLGNKGCIRYLSVKCLWSARPQFKKTDRNKDGETKQCTAGFRF